MPKFKAAAYIRLSYTDDRSSESDSVSNQRKLIENFVERNPDIEIVSEKIERRKVLILRVLIVFFIAISLLIALNPPTFIAQLMGISWGALAGAFLAPFMMGLYWRGVTRMSVWACFIWGVGLTVVNMLLGSPINPVNCGAIAMLGGFVVVFVVSIFTSKMDRAYVNHIFTCYQK